MKAQFEAAKEVERLRSELRDLRLLKQPTAYIDKFPDNIEAIADLVKRTNDRLVIIADYCAYGHYSAPEQHKSYRDALSLILSKNKSVDAHVYNRATASDMTLVQFGLSRAKAGRSTFEEQRATPRFRNYFRFHQKTGTPKQEPGDTELFDKLMQAQQEACINDLRNHGATIKDDIASPLPVFMWIRDRQEAIFSIYNLGENTREVSLITRDPSLVGLLSDLADSVRPVP